MASSMRQRQAKKTVQRPQFPGVEEISSTSPESDGSSISTFTAFKLFFSLRMCAALWSNIGDCDETFNYWEPLHYLLFKQGFQTWEYSPQYALRSYLYLWLYKLPASTYVSLFGPSKILVFYFVRGAMAFGCSLCETYFFHCVKHRFGSYVSNVVLATHVVSAGFFISSTAFLPSSFAMYCTLVSYGAWFKGNKFLAIFATALSGLWGWPFAALTGVPILLDYLLRRDLFQITKDCLSSFFLLAIPLVLIDTYYFGKIVVAPLNILKYNVFSEHGPDLYGTESWSFYFKNGFLNFNVIFVLSLLSPFVIVYYLFCLRLSTGKVEPRERLKKRQEMLVIVGLLVWILVFFTRPHKEERFLFPIYPLITLTAAIVIDKVQQAIRYLLAADLELVYIPIADIPALLTVLVYALLSFSRIGALHYNYAAPMDIYRDLNLIANPPDPLQQQQQQQALFHQKPPSDKEIHLCVGKEWYRFASSFFLPEKWSLQFIQSEFKGQLPKPYATVDYGTRIVPDDMNDANREEPSRYVDIRTCHYLIDTDTGVETSLEPNYSRDSGNWTVVLSANFTDSARSHWFFRAFYVPYLSDDRLTLVSYNLLKVKATRKRRTSSTGP